MMWRCGGLLIIGFLLFGGEDLDVQRRASVGRGLAFLGSQQQPGGRVGDHHGTAVTALAGLAHLAAGTVPGREGPGATLRKAVLHVLSRQGADGYFGDDRMYGHGLATLFCAEALGQTRDEDLDARLREALAKAVGLTLAAQRVAKAEAFRGGWRYQPGEDSSDLSLTGWQLLSLRAARAIGVEVPEQALHEAVDFVRRVSTPDGRVGYHVRGDDHPALRGLAVLALSYSPEDAALAARIAKRVEEDPIDWRGPWFFYRVHYDAMGLAAGAPALWAVYRQRLVRVLVEHQAANGSWPAPPGDNEAEHGPAYATAMAVLALCVDDGLLPAWRR